MATNKPPSNRQTRKLEHNKGFRVQIGEGPPSKLEGNDGEFTLRTTNSGLKLFCKFKSHWYIIGEQSLRTPAGSDTDSHANSSQGTTTINSRTGELLMGGVINMSGSRSRQGLIGYGGSKSSTYSSPINGSGKFGQGLVFQSPTDSAYFAGIHVHLEPDKRLYFNGATGNSFLSYTEDGSEELLQCFVGGDNVLSVMESNLGNQIIAGDNTDIRLEGVQDSATGNGKISFVTQRGTTPAAAQDGDDLMEITWNGYNDAGTPEPIMYGKISSEITDASDGQETADLTIWSKGDIHIQPRGGQLIIDDDGVDDPDLHLRCTNTFQFGPTLFIELENDNANDNDRIGMLIFQGQNDSNANVNYGSMSGYSLDVTAATLLGQLKFNVLAHSGVDALVIEGVSNLRADVDIAYGNSSVTTVKGGLVIDNATTTATSAQTKAQVDARRFVVHESSNAARMSTVNTWYVGNQSFGTSIVAGDWSTDKFTYSLYNSNSAVKLKSWTWVGEHDVSKDVEYELWDVTIPSNGTAAPSTVAKVGSTQSASVTANSIYTMAQTDLDYTVAASHSLYLLVRYTSGSGNFYNKGSVTLEFELI